MHRLLLIGVLLVVAACGDDDVDVGSGGDPDTPVSNSPDPGAGAADSAGGGDPRIVEPTPGLDGVVVNAIDSVVLRDDAELEVRFYGGVEECYGVDHVDVVETDVDVTVTVSTGSRPEAAGQACIEIAELQAVIVRLGQPLGDRAVIDGSSGSRVTDG